MNLRIAIVGMACEYPDARSPLALWEMVLAKRRAFRQLPACRLRSADYLSLDRAAPDTTYTVQAAVLDGWAFDRERFHVTGQAYRAADLAHWLALDVAARALADAGFAAGVHLPRSSTGVVLGNTLTGEFSRAATLRLRWPYVRRVVEERLHVFGMAEAARRAWLAEVEARFKAPFAPVDEETLAGGLSNTIAGRICNHFDFGGGGFTVDGACSSSLLAVAQACSALAAGDLDAALAGGVDLSLDPFELVGFAKAGALAQDTMRVYDARASGFWPGEGCGFVVLMREPDAAARGLPIHACIEGWGISSDGAGGITRPDADGQRLALERAWRRAGVSVATAGAFEGHGTGTPVGDRIELEVLLAARRAAGGEAPAALGSIKANFGHTKAAAGIAGLLKATFIAREHVLPPATAAEQPHELLLAGDGPRHLRLLPGAEPWAEARPLRVGVSAMGFGGINTHVVVGAATPVRRTTLTAREALLSASAQDAELFVLAADDSGALRAQVASLATVAPELSLAELSDLAAALLRRDLAGPARAAVVARSPAELASALARLEAAFVEDATLFDVPGGAFLGLVRSAPRLGFLFPGQGAPAHLDGGALRRRFPAAAAVYAHAALPREGDGVATAVAQPAIVAASLAGLAVLAELGIAADHALGHSLGELTALAWAGAFDADAVVRLAQVRGRAMTDLGAAGGMASLAADGATVAALLREEFGDGQRAEVVIAGYNAGDQTVVSGGPDALAALLRRARRQGVAAVRLPVSHAFHSPLVMRAAGALRQHFATEPPAPTVRAMLSTVAGGELAPGADPRELLVSQVTSPVRFTDALAAATGRVDLWLEVGPGQTLTPLVQRNGGAPAVALDASGPSLRAFLTGVGAAFVRGAPLRVAPLDERRFTRPFDPARIRQFLANPCEAAPDLPAAPPPAAAPTPAPDVAAPPGDTPAPREVVHELIAAHAELPRSAVRDDARLLADLHLNSIAVGQIAAKAARRLGLPPPLSPTEFAGATVGGLVQALKDMPTTGAHAAPDPHAPPPGLGPWVRSFAVDWTPVPPPAPVLPPAAQTVSIGPSSLLGVTSSCDGSDMAPARGGKGTLVLATLAGSTESAASDEATLLAAARAAQGAGRDARLVVVHHGRAAAGFVRSFHLETGLDAVAVDVPSGHVEGARWVQVEAAGVHGCSEVRYDADGTRLEPRWRAFVPGPAAERRVLREDDVLLVTGGGKGIAAECALDLAAGTGARVALLGRSLPERDAELSRNLARFRLAGIEVRYVPADVTEPAGVAEAVDAVRRACGAPTVLLHGAGRNEPRLLHDLDETTFHATLAPKVDGLRHVLAALEPHALRLLVAFGSVIARVGLRGEADYGHANEALRLAIEAWQHAHPHCRTLVVEWSVWSGTGMGERLGRVDALLRAGITPIPIDLGVATLRRLLAAPDVPPAVVVAGRLGEARHLRWARPELPLLRFLERPLVHTPDVELLADAELAVARDPYLADHDLDGDRLLPAVLGLEAMAQAHRALTDPERRAPLVFTGVELSRPVVVPGDGQETVRLLALRDEGGAVDVGLRCASTAFAVDHFRARLDVGGDRPPSLCVDDPTQDLDLDPARDLYGTLLFQGRRFQRLSAYQVLRARRLRVQLAGVGAAAPAQASPWFGAFLPTTLVLGDPGLRDAALHAVQACVPHHLLLPLGVQKIHVGILEGSGPFTVHGVELRQEGDVYVWDLAIHDAKGREVERWEELRFKAVAPRTIPTWHPALLSTYLERRLDELVDGAAITVRVEPEATARTPESTRLDGKPLATGNGHHVSFARARGLRLSVAASTPVGCDLEPVAARDAGTWRDLLGEAPHALATLVAREQREPEDTAATRVWNVIECAKKAGLPEPCAPVLVRTLPDGWVLLRAGGARIASYVARVSSEGGTLALAVLVGDPVPR